MIEKVATLNKDRAAALKKSLYASDDWAKFVADLEKVHHELVVSKSTDDHILSRIWFIRELCSYGVERLTAENLWAAGEDEFGNKLSSVVEEGETCLVLPGYHKRSIARHAHVGIDG